MEFPRFSCNFMRGNRRQITEMEVSDEEEDGVRKHFDDFFARLSLIYPRFFADFSLVCAFVFADLFAGTLLLD